jgi:UDP-glucose 4-epimerase
VRRDIASLVAEHQPDVIVHLAAIYSPPSYRNPRFARKINVEGTRNLVLTARALPEPPLILKASSATVPS